MPTFKADCDRAVELLSKQNHMALVDIQYELDLGEARLRSVISFLRERHGYVDVFLDSEICQEHKTSCLMLQTEYEERDKKRTKLIHSPNTGNLKSALEIFIQLEGVEKKPVPRQQFWEMLVKSMKFTEADADKTIKTMFREGLIYESKPGYFRRINAEPG